MNPSRSRPSRCRLHTAIPQPIPSNFLHQRWTRPTADFFSLLPTPLKSGREKLEGAQIRLEFVHRAAAAGPSGLYPSKQPTDKSYLLL